MLATLINTTVIAQSELYVAHWRCVKSTAMVDVYLLIIKVQSLDRIDIETGNAYIRGSHNPLLLEWGI